MKRRIGFTIVYFLIAIALILFINNLVSAPKHTEIKYSEFKVLLGEGLINNLNITKAIIHGELTDNAHKRLFELREIENEKEFKRLQEFNIFRVVRMEDPNLVRELGERNIRYSVTQEVTWIKTLFPVLLTILIIVVFWSYIFRRMGASSEGMMAIGRSKAKIYVEGETKVAFDDVAGVDEAKEELKEVIEFLRNPQKFQMLGGKIPKGILLVGPPGTGKTLLARAVAGEAKVPFLSLSGSAFVEMFVGVGAARVRDLFSQAEKSAPCIIFIDEIDALGKARGISPVTGIDEREQTLTQLLSEMDGFDTKKGVIIMAATNRPEILDPALLRAGRFDRHILVDRPDLKGREDIFRVHIKKVRCSPDIDIKVLASMTSGMVGADLANIVNEAALLAVRRNKEIVEMADFEEAIERVIAGLEKKSRVINKREKEIIAYHECGHAIVANMLPRTDKVRRVSIIPRGIAALGYTVQLPTEERYLLTRSELLDRITVMLGGRAAEEVIFNEVSTGAKNDLDRATDIARSMVTSYGMSEKLGPLSFDRGRPLFLEVPWSAPKEYSEDTSRKIDEEVRTIVSDAYEKARTILTEKLEKLKMIASILLDKEVIEGDELKKLLGQ